MGLRRSVCLALALFTLFVSGAAARGNATTSATGAHRFLWGAWIGKQFTGTAAPWDWNAVKDFEARNAGGRQISVIHWGVMTPWEHPFNHWVGTFNDVQGEGAVSLVDMDTGTVPLRAIADGAYDSALQTWASQAASWGQDFFLRFDWEMNGRWYPWGTRPSNKNTPAAFVAAWRHVHNIFSAAGATNVDWVWCPNYDPYHEMTNLAKLYPGKAYVDWTCLDGYNRDTPWTSFNNLYASTYREVTRLAPNKPLMLGEVASTEHGGRKAQWIGICSALFFMATRTSTLSSGGISTGRVTSTGTTGRSRRPTAPRSPFAGVLGKYSPGRAVGSAGKHGRGA